MFWFGPGLLERKFDDYRPVHDSDGLLMCLENREWVWRPLNDPPVLRHQHFPAKNLHGFGLLQRDRDFANYQDLFNPYHVVPSVWVEPLGLWGDGEVHLVELSTQYEGLDNIVAFWEPKPRPEPLQPFRIGCVMYWTRETDKKLSENKVLATRIGADTAHPQVRQFALDFGGPKLAALPQGTVPKPVTSSSENGTIVDCQVFPIPFSKEWRVMLKMEPRSGNQAPVVLRCALTDEKEALTETWTYYWSPP